MQKLEELLIHHLESTDEIVSALRKAKSSTFSVIEIAALSSPLRYPEAIIKEANKSLEVRSDDVDMLCLRAKAYFDVKKYIRALLDLSDALKRSPDETTIAFIRMLKGHCFRVLGVYDRALEEYKKALVIVKSANIYNICGVLLLLKDSSEDALEYLDEAVKIASENSLFRAYRAVALFRLASFDQALKEIDHAIKISGSSVTWYWVLRCYILDKMHEKEKASESLAVFEETCETDLECLIARGIRDYLNGEISGAYKEIENILKRVEEERSNSKENLALFLLIEGLGIHLPPEDDMIASL